MSSKFILHFEDRDDPIDWRDAKVFTSLRAAILYAQQNLAGSQIRDTNGVLIDFYYIRYNKVLEVSDQYILSHDVWPNWWMRWEAPHVEYHEPLKAHR